MKKSEQRQLKADLRKEITDQALKARVRGILTAQKNRAKKLGVDGPIYTADYLLYRVQQSLLHGCIYCEAKITPKSFTVDHRVPVSRGGSFDAENIAICCKPCNFQKGAMSSSDFVKLLSFLANYSPEVTVDIKRRLTVGGRWSK